jgi:hypothetical protein
MNIVLDMIVVIAVLQFTVFLILTALANGSDAAAPT